MDDILARSEPFNVDCHAALQEKGTSKPQTPSTTQILTSGTRNLDNNEDISSNDEDVVDHLIIERQKGKRKASAFAVKPMEPPP